VGWRRLGRPLDRLQRVERPRRSPILSKPFTPATLIQRVEEALAA
jgi:hypothetical protein